MDKKKLSINSRIGRLEVDADRVIRFPRGLIGFEALRDFVLVEFKPGTPFHFLQSLELPSMGMMLADPFPFLPDYQIRLGAVEQKLLKVKSIRDLAILVSVTVPKGNPAETTLNLTGPICVNARKHLGLQAPQSESAFPPRVFLRDLGEPDKKAAQM
jgi:flagellar assembly factor FliW